MAVKPIPVEEYAAKLLEGRDSITTAEMPFEGDFDFVMLLMLTASYDENTSTYELELTHETVKRGRYNIPLLTISRRL